MRETNWNKITVLSFKIFPYTWHCPEPRDCLKDVPGERKSRTINNPDLFINCFNVWSVCISTSPKANLSNISYNFITVPRGLEYDNYEFPQLICRPVNCYIKLIRRLA